MRVKIYRGGCDVETHEIPPLVGRTITRDGIEVGTERLDCGSESEAEADDVADIIERFTFSPEEGGVLRRLVRKWERSDEGWRHVDRVANGTFDMVIIAPEETEAITRIDVDDVQAWPEEDTGGDRVRELEGLVDRLVSEAGA